jgi:hypothetical protein
MKVFLEEQKFTQPLLIIVLIMAFTITGSVFYYNIDKLSGSSGEILGVLSGIFIVLTVMLFFVILKLKTRVDENGIHFKFYPFQSSYKIVKWNQISNLYIRNYNAFSEFGGWGYKFNSKNNIGKAYTAKGSVGLQLVLNDGSKLLIGTQKKEELQRVITNYKNKEANETI